MESEKFAAGILHDLCRAFDFVNHDIFLDKLQWYRICAVVVRWFMIYLRGSVQFVKIGFKTGSSVSLAHLCHLPVERSVPQNSILCPALFLIFVNDITHFLFQFNIVMYAGDINAVLFGPSVREAEKISNILLQNINE